MYMGLYNIIKTIKNNIETYSNKSFKSYPYSRTGILLPELERKKKKIQKLSLDSRGLCVQDLFDLFGF